MPALLSPAGAVLAVCRCSRLGSLGLSVPLGRLCRAEGVWRCVWWLADGWQCLRVRTHPRWAHSPPGARGLAHPQAGPPHPMAPRVTQNPASSVCLPEPAAHSRRGHPPGIRAACLHHWTSTSVTARAAYLFKPGGALSQCVFGCSCPGFGLFLRLSEAVAPVAFTALWVWSCAAPLRCSSSCLVSATPLAFWPPLLVSTQSALAPSALVLSFP